MVPNAAWNATAIPQPKTILVSTYALCVCVCAVYFHCRFFVMTTCNARANHQSRTKPAVYCSQSVSSRKRVPWSELLLVPQINLIIIISTTRRGRRYWFDLLCAIIICSSIHAKWNLKMLHYGIVLDCCLAFSWQTCSPQNDLKVSSTEFSLETTKSL